MKITDYIGTGESGAVTKTDLCTITGLDERKVRRLIAKERENGVPIVSNSRKKGYYLAETDEDYNIIGRELMSRATKLINQHNSICRNRQERGQMTL